MSTHIGIGFSQNIDTQSAARDAAFEAKTNLRQDRIDLTLVFCSIHYDPHEVLPVVRKILNSQRLIGSSTAGIIRDASVQLRGIGILTVTSSDIQFGIASTEDVRTDNPVELGADLANRVIKDFGQSARQAFLFFMDDKLRWTSDMLKGLQGIFGNIFPIVGAGSSDDFHFGTTFQLYQDEVFHQSITGLLMGGQMSVGVAGRHGWRPLGKPRIIDEVEYNIIKTIDGQKASSLYDEYFGEYAQDLRSDKLGRMAILYPLGIYVEGSREYLLRNTVDILSDGSIVCQGDIPAGSEVHIMIGNKDSCQSAAYDAALEAQKNLLGKEAQLVIVIECLSRLKLLGRGAYRELQQVREVFGENVPMFGMYSNGEVCPIQTTERYKKPHHQNESIVILAIA